MRIAAPALLYAAWLAAAAPAQQVEPPPVQEVMLWPDGAPGALGEAEQDRPRLLVHHAGPRPGDADAPRRPAILICPGGGYGHLAMAHEGRDIGAWCNTLGITGLVLDYRHRGKGYGHPWPLRDAQRAMRLARHRADAWGLDPDQIGVIGFSAGGHLASSLSVHHDAGAATADDAIERRSCRPDFAVLCYPVIAFGQDFSHRGSQRNLLGAEPDPALVREMSSERQVDANTPPTFLWHTAADPGVSAQNSLAYLQALLQHGVPGELHVFEQGRHGIGLAKGHDAALWPELCRRWLITRGVLDE